MRWLFMLLLVVGVGVLLADELQDTLNRLKSDDWRERQEARKVLKEHALEWAGKLLQVAREQKDPEVRKALEEALALAKYPSPAALEEAEKIIKEWLTLRQDKEKANKEGKALVERLKKLRNIEYWLVRLIGWEQDKTRRKAVSELLWGLLGSKLGSGDVAIIKTKDGKVVARANVVVVVVGTGGKKDVKVWKDGKLVTSDCIPNLEATPLTALIKVLRSDDAVLVRRALDALAKLGDKRAVGAIAPLLNRKDVPEGTLSAAIEALRHLTGVVFTDKQGLDERRKAWQDWWNKNKDNRDYKPSKVSEDTQQIPKDAKGGVRVAPIRKVDKDLQKMLEQLHKQLKQQLEQIRKESLEKAKRLQEKQRKQEGRKDEEGEF
ncbi:MAG: hypothetical protein DRP63_04530 [Planctomycetota bacterium]|nr:MAG: hypothetical protein DRP63_04530 [Planctomycetota bacterium]